MTTLHERPQDTAQARAEKEDRSRLHLALILAPVFLIASGLFAWWAADSITDHQWVLDILSGISMVLFLVEAVRAFTLWRRTRH